MHRLLAHHCQNCGTLFLVPVCGGEGEAGQGRGQEGQPRHGAVVGVLGVWRLVETK